ncbi:hypothetical protein [Acinetobacter celticus]|uniref:Lipoprotein n=1 Tax=Acinetobacter celticus TaxID=1891224 RepID=A0A1C3D037_9GAMM|nr:hypothetical protein [Acinetobacter celticus]ODA14391.1 hypothetical protein BBP83_00830 [Acinetobacter celticus]
MKFTLSYKRPLGLLSVLFLLIGCASSPTLSTAQREAYLQQFIGKSSQEIRTQLNLNQIGYQQADAPVLSAHRLTYTVARTINIPIPMAQNPAMGMGAGTVVPIPVGSATQSYDVHLNCQISFILEHDIAKALQMTGRTC